MDTSIFQIAVSLSTCICMSICHLSPIVKLEVDAPVGHNETLGCRLVQVVESLHVLVIELDDFDVVNDSLLRDLKMDRKTVVSNGSGVVMAVDVATDRFGQDNDVALDCEGYTGSVLGERHAQQNNG